MFVYNQHYFHNFKRHDEIKDTSSIKYIFFLNQLVVNNVFKDSKEEYNDDIKASEKALRVFNILKEGDKILYDMLIKNNIKFEDNDFDSKLFHFKLVDNFNNFIDNIKNSKVSHYIVPINNILKVANKGFNIGHNLYFVSSLGYDGYFYFRSIYNLYEVYNNEFKGLSNKGVEEYFELDKKYDNRVNYAEDFYTIDTNRLESVNNNNLAIENKLHNNDINNNMLEVANNRLEL